MARPRAAQSGRSRSDGQARRVGWRAPRRAAPAASTRHGAAMARRLQPTRSGEAAASRESRVMVAPVVPPDPAATVITILPPSREVRQVLTGPKGLLDALRPGSLLLEMTSADPPVTRELAAEVAARGSALIDAPVSGGVRGATEGTLAIMVGGDAALLERARPVLARMGKNIFHAGPVGAGHAIKLVNNMCSGGILALTIEAVAVAARSRVDPAPAVEIIDAPSRRPNASDYK